MQSIECRLPRILIAGLLTALLVVHAWAQWMPCGIVLCDGSGDQESPAIVSDGEGGAIVFWSDGRPGIGQADMYAQRVSGTGEIQWTANGVELSGAALGQIDPDAVSDGVGGAIVAWKDGRNGGGNWDIYAQRVNANGDTLWAADGVAVCANAGSQEAPVVASDGSGGVITAWQDYRSGYYDIYAQRVDSDGDTAWASAGIPVCTSAWHQYSPGIAADGAGGAIVTWQDNRSVDYDIYAQRLDSNGDTLWAADGVVLCGASWDQSVPTIVADGEGGAIVAWKDNRDAVGDIVAQRVDAYGDVQWASGGVTLCGDAATQTNPRAISDGAGGAVVVWTDNRNGNWDIYAQRVDASGAALWTTDGVALCTNGAEQALPAIVSDGLGGAIVSWDDYRGGNWDVYAQHVDWSGTVRWATDGVEICAAGGNQRESAVVSLEAGGALVAWTDGRSGNLDIYAQRMGRHGYWGDPAPVIASIEDVPGDQGGQVRVSFMPSRLDSWPDPEITYYSIWRSLSPAAVHALRHTVVQLTTIGDARPELIGRAYCSSASGDWELVGAMEAHLWAQYGYTSATLRDSTGVDPGWEYYCVSAHGSEPFVFWDSAPDSGYSVDNLSPCVPQGLAGQFREECRVFLHWNQNAEGDLSHYAIYRGAEPAFRPDEGNRIGTTVDTSFVDGSYCYGGEWYYKVSALDLHENESGFAVLTPSDITGAREVERRYGNTLYQNVPNPFASSTWIAFSTERETSVLIEVFDAKGRLIRVLADDVRCPDLHVVNWDGRDASGRPVAAGTYFYRLNVAGWSGVKKMTVAR